MTSSDVRLKRVCTRAMVSPSGRNTAIEAKRAVTVVPTFAPTVTENALGSERSPDATRGTKIDVVMEED
jgi:hypothetical protein